MQLSKKYGFVAIVFAHMFSMQAVDSAIEQSQEPVIYELQRISVDGARFAEQKEQCASSFDTAHHMRYAVIPAALVAAYLAYLKWEGIKAVAWSGAETVRDLGKHTFNGVALVANTVAWPFGRQPMTPFDLTPPVAAAAVVAQLEPGQIQTLLAMTKQFAFWTFCGSIAKSTVSDLATRGVIFVYRHSFDNGAQDIKLFVQNETSLAEIRFYLRDWMQDMQTTLAESSVESLYDTIYEFDKQVIADAERIIAFMSSLKEYTHLQTDLVDRKIKMLIDETNGFAEAAERMLNEQGDQGAESRQLILKALMHRTVRFIALIDREVDSFVKVVIRPEEKKK